jgi:hypothetical protein
MSSPFLASLKKEDSSSTTTEQSRDCFFYLVDKCKYVQCDLKHRDVDLSKAVLPAWQKMAARIIYEERRRIRNLETQISELKTRNRNGHRDIEDLEENRRLQNTAYDDMKDELNSKTNECDQLRGQYNAQIQILNESATKITELERTIQMFKDEKNYRDTVLNYNPASILHPYSQPQPQPQAYPQTYPYYGGYYPNPPPTTSNPGLFYYTPPLPSPDQVAQMHAAQATQIQASQMHAAQAAQTQATQAQAQAQVAQIQATQVQAQVTQNLHYQSPVTPSSNLPASNFVPITAQPAYGQQQTSHSPKYRYKPY